MKKLVFTGNTRATIKSWDDSVKVKIGNELNRIENGLRPINSRSLNSSTPGLWEIRVKCGGEWRVVYTIKAEELVLVLAAFMKKSRKTPKHELQKAIRRWQHFVT